MSLDDVVNPKILSQPVYEPGRPIDDVAREMGLDPAKVIKVASNENPLGTSPLALAAMTEALNQSHLYPDGGCVHLRQKLAAKHGVEPEQIVIGNGSNELLELLGHVFLTPSDEAVMGTPAFIVYKLVTLLFGANAVEVPLRDHLHDLDAMEAAVSDRTKLVFLPCPNNPTGTLNPPQDVLRWIDRLPERVIVVIDEAYAEYLESEQNWSGVLDGGRRLIVLRTFSKIYGMAALRIGYGITSREIAALLQRARQPFNVNAIAQVGAIAALDDHAWIDSCRETNRLGLEQLEKGFSEMKLEWVKSHGNFVLVRTGDGARTTRALQERGIIVRPLVGYGLPDWVRFSVGTADENSAVLRLLDQVCRSN